MSARILQSFQVKRLNTQEIVFWEWNNLNSPKSQSLLLKWVLVGCWWKCTRWWCSPLSSPGAGPTGDRRGSWGCVSQDPNMRTEVVPSGPGLGHTGGRHTPLPLPLWTWTHRRPTQEPGARLEVGLFPGFKTREFLLHFKHRFSFESFECWFSGYCGDWWRESQCGQVGRPQCTSAKSPESLVGAGARPPSIGGLFTRGWLDLGPGDSRPGTSQPENSSKNLRGNLNFFKDYLHLDHSVIIENTLIITLDFALIFVCNGWSSKGFNIKNSFGNNDTWLKTKPQNVRRVLRRQGLVPNVKLFWIVMCRVEQHKQNNQTLIPASRSQLAWLYHQNSGQSSCLLHSRGITKMNVCNFHEKN